MMPGTRLPPRGTATLLCLLLAAALAGCSSPQAQAPSTAASSAAQPSTAPTDPTGSAPTSTPTPTPTPTPSPLRLAPPAAAGITWTAAGSTVAGRPATYLATTRNRTVGLLWMDPTLLTFRFIPGLSYPEGSPVRPADRQPATWVGLMAAAFNGGFKLRDNVGGYFYAGRVVKPLRPGLASLVIDSTGRLGVTDWGPQSRTAGLLVVRQNLKPLVLDFRAQTSPRDSNSTWGWADHDLPHANRSALGELADGSLVYVYGQELTAADMAAALVAVHAKIAIMLDMNLSQPGGFVYSHTAGKVTGQRVLPTVYHQPSVYFRPWTKDFVVALLPGPVG